MKNFILILGIFICCNCNSEDVRKPHKPITKENQELQVIEFKRANMIVLDSNTFAVSEMEDHLITGDKVKSDGQVLYKLDSISVPPKENIFIKLTTKSSLPKDSLSHNWVLLEKNVDVNAFIESSSKSENYIASEYADDIFARTNFAGNGETVEVSFLGPKEKGEYIFLCTFPKHLYEGESGYFIVK